MRYAIVTDSTSDLPQEWVERYNITVVPAIIVIDGHEYLDGATFSRQEYYERLPRMTNLPTTAAPSSGTFGEVYEKLFTQGIQHIFSIHLSGALSAMVNAATIAAAEFHNLVTVIDSRQISMGIGYQVMAAAEAIQAGLSLGGIKQKVMDIQNRLRLVAMLDTLEYLRRSGRVSALRASLGAMLRMRLFVEVREGQVALLEQSRTRHKSIERLGEILNNLGTLHKLTILHTNVEDEAREFLVKFAPRFASLSPIINVTTTIGTHVGPKGIGFVAVL